MVIQALVFSLFATLFVRLYYLQVVGGADYQAQAASQSVREIVEQPARGLVVDAMGRPLVANRSSWVVSLDRTMLDKLADGARDKLVARVARAVSLPSKEVEARLVTCGHEGSVAGTCWNGSPFQPVPVATDVQQRVALKILEQPEDYPAVLAQQQSVRAYPRPYGINLAHVLGYLSPITEDELDAAEKHDDGSVNGASVVGRAGVEKQYDRWLRGMPGYEKVAVDSMGRVLGEDSTASARPGDTLVTSIDARVQSVVERQLNLMMRTARTVTDPVTRRPYVADSGAALVMEARTGRIVAMASQPTYDPETWVGGISDAELAAALLRGGRHAAALAGDAGPVRARLDVEAVHDRGRADQRLHHRHRAAVHVGLPGRQPGLQELRVRRLRHHRLRQGARGLLQHLLLPDRLRVLAPLRLRRRRREGPRPAGRGGQDLRLRHGAPASTSLARPPAGSPTANGSSTTSSR